MYDNITNLTPKTIKKPSLATESISFLRETGHL